MTDAILSNPDHSSDPTSTSPHRDRETARDKPTEPPSDSHGTNKCYTVNLFGVHIAALVIDGQERLCLAQISNTLLKKFSYNEIHNRRVALGITCVQCTPVQLEILRRANAMPVSSRRCGMINKREAERLCKSFLTENRPPKLPVNFSFDVYHECTWGCRGAFVPARYNSSRAKCIRCSYCSLFSSPNKFIFHAHRTPTSKFHTPDGPNFNSWRRHIKLVETNPAEEFLHAWEDVKAMFNGGSRKRSFCDSSSHNNSKLPPSFSIKDTTESLNNSPPKITQFDFDAPNDPALSPTRAVNMPYPLMPIPNRSVSSSNTDTCSPTENSPVKSSPSHQVHSMFPTGHLSPPSFSPNPFMEFVWAGGRTGYPIPTTALWSKTIGIPFGSYYQPLVESDIDIPGVIDPGSPGGILSRKTRWDNIDKLNNSMKPKAVPARHPYLQDLRQNAYCASAFRPVVTAKGCLDYPPKRVAFTGATDHPFIFPVPNVKEACYISTVPCDHRAVSDRVMLYQQQQQQCRKHQLKTKDGDNDLTVSVTKTERDEDSPPIDMIAQPDAGAGAPSQVILEGYRDRYDLGLTAAVVHPAKRQLSRPSEVEGLCHSPDNTECVTDHVLRRHPHHNLTASRLPSTVTEKEDNISHNNEERQDALSLLSQEGLLSSSSSSHGGGPGLGSGVPVGVCHD